MLQEYRVVWQGCPHIHHPRKIDFVMAESPENANALIKDHIERCYGIAWKTIHLVELYEKPTVGYVK